MESHGNDSDKAAKQSEATKQYPKDMSLDRFGFQVFTVFSPEDVKL